MKQSGLLPAPPLQAARPAKRGPARSPSRPVAAERVLP
jgi:hypothetical protein